MLRQIFAVLLCSACLLLPMDAAAQESSGTAVFRGTIVQGDSLAVALQGVSPAPAGSHYEAWLRSADGTERTALGTVAVGEGGGLEFTYVSPRSENLVGVNAVFELTVEPDGDTDPNPGAVVMRGEIPAAAVPAVRELLFRWPESRFGTPAAEGALSDAQLADTIAQYLLEAATAGDLAAARQYAERLVNLVEGQAGASFGDHNGDGQAEGPGDGTGLLNYAWGSYWRARIAADAVPDDVWVGLHAGHVSSSAEQMVDWLGIMRDAGIAFMAVSDPAEAAVRAQELRDAAANALRGHDSNGDGVLDVSLGEGGAEQVLDHAQLMAAMRVGPA